MDEMRLAAIFVLGLLIGALLVVIVGTLRRMK